MRAGFDTAHRTVFGHARPEHGVELVNLRLVATQTRGAPHLEWGALAVAAPAAMRPVYWHGAWHDSAVHERETLPAGFRVAGPAIINEPGGTTVLPPGWTAEVEPSGSLLCRREQGSACNVVNPA
jgi:N-methylhydantoinase A